VSESVRSFIAVPVPAETASRLAAAQERLRASGDDIKWVRPESIHLTLKFLGAVEPERLRALWQSLREALAGQRSFMARLRGLGAFPGPARARVVWAGLAEGAEELGALAARVEEVCAQHGFPPEERPFRAHLTLGRVRRPAPNPGLEAAIAAGADAELGEVPVERVLLMKSELRRDGARYHVLDEIALL